jgi:hypothetical protein
MDQHDGCARPETHFLARPPRGTCITRTVDLANPRLIGVWKWNFEEANRRLYAVCVFAPNVLRDDYPLEDLQHLKDCIAQQGHKVEKMIDWTRTQLDAAGLQAGEPGRVEPLSADIRTPLASAYADLFLRADLAIQLLDALWVQGELTDAGHAERTGAMRRAPLSALGAIQRVHARCRERIEELYRQRESGPL